MNVWLHYIKVINWVHVGVGKHGLYWIKDMFGSVVTATHKSEHLLDGVPNSFLKKK